MTKDIWIISDTHFNHANILGFTDSEGDLIRPGFKDVDDMNESMIYMWNSVVKPGDKVYHLGDVVMGKPGWMEDNWSKLNGSKRLIVGNHDRIKYLSSGSWFKEVYMWRQLKDHGILLTHTPQHESTLMWGKIVNVHGHIHQNKSPQGLYINMSVEEINYTPVHIEDVKLKAKSLREMYG